MSSLVSCRLLRELPQVQFCATRNGSHGPPPPMTKLLIGKREVVGYGINGESNYIDTVMALFPAIRFKEDVGEIATLRQKEKGDWKKMTKEEKKVLYRASFCQTLVESEAPTGEWKSIIGIVLSGVAVGLLGYLWMNKYVYLELPETITNEELKKAQIKRMIALHVNPVEGFASNYDYEKGRWKE